MQVSSQFVSQLKEQEGFSAVPYLCTAHKVTIGYGTNLEAHPRYINHYPDIYAMAVSGTWTGQRLCNALQQAGMRWDKYQAESAMMAEVMDCVQNLLARCKAYTLLLDRAEYARAEVLVNMAFNLGTKGLLGFKKMLAAIEGKDYAQAAIEMLDSAWSRQVKGRARTLAAQMRTGEYPQ